MTLYRKDGTLYMDVVPEEDSYRLRELSAEHALYLYFKLSEYVDIPRGTYCYFQGIRYTLHHSAQVTKQHNRYYDYVLEMMPPGYEIHTRMMRNVTDGRLTFNVTASATLHLTMLVNCLNAGQGGRQTWHVGNVAVQGSERMVSYDYVTCAEALSLIATAFDTEYEIDADSRTIHLGRVEYYRDKPLTMSYGRGNGFTTGVSRRGGEVALQRIFVQGGDRNIDPATYGRDAQVGDTMQQILPDPSSTLLLPFIGVRTDAGDVENTAELWYNGQEYAYTNPIADGSAITPATSAWRHYRVSRDRRSVTLATDYDATTLVEGCYDATEIYPSRVGTVSLVETESGTDSDGNAVMLYNIYDSAVDCPDYSQYSLAGETMTLIFQSGDLAGREFALATNAQGVVVNPYVTGKGRKFELVPLTTDNTTLPNENIAPKAGDTYAVFHCIMPETYLHDDDNHSGAEWDMFREVAAYLYSRGEDEYIFHGDVDGIWTKQHWDDDEVIAGGVGQYMKPGAHILFKDNIMPDGILLRVTAIKEYVNTPHSPQLTLSNALARQPISLTNSGTLTVTKAVDTLKNLTFGQLQIRTQTQQRQADIDIRDVKKVLGETYGSVNTLSGQMQVLVNVFDGKQVSVCDDNKCVMTTISFGSMESKE